ncbi:hypothetical protein [Herbiconiux sp. UC225_62]|uniref:hypothetical protein n=1 Tax=Herbiconiux sp. UC225_62 TaxID=3350168 RepID=UPI0036D2F1AF
MTADETIVFLTRAALLDPRMKRVDPAEYADMAIAWADLLDDVPLEVALAALRKHYRESSDTITPARIVDLANLAVPPALPDITAEVEAESKRAQLAAAGVTEAEYEAHRFDAAWIAARFQTREIEATDA